MRFRSVKFKVTILFVLILGIILSLYSGVLYYSLYKTLYNELDHELEYKAKVMSSSLQAYMSILNEDENSLLFAARRIITLKGEYPGDQVSLGPEQKRRIVEIEKKWLQVYDKLDLSEDYVHFVTIKGRSLVKSKNVSPDLRNILLKKLKQVRNRFSKFKFQKRNLRLLQVPFVFDNEKEYVIQIASSQKPIVALLEKSQFVFMTSIPLILVLTSFVGRFLSGRILFPVAEVTETAKNITHENLSGRLKHAYRDEEMRVLVEAFNDMIARLEESFQHISEFSSQVAHELKTPIAIIRGECEIALRKTRNPEEYRRALRVNLEEAKRMLKTIDDLLLLAKLDYRPEIFTFEEFSVADFFNEIYEQSRILSAEKKIQVALTLPKVHLRIRGDKVHLRRLFFNIIHNAIKFTPPQGRISITVIRQKDSIDIEIKDSGPGISREYISRVFDKFFHKPPCENEPATGSGLGLSIALAIAKIHKGTISVQSQAGHGATFSVSLPLS